MPAAGAASASNPRCGAQCLAYILGYHPLDRDGFPCCPAGRRLAARLGQRPSPLLISEFAKLTFS